MKPENKTGIFEGVTFEEYKAIDRVNQSSLKDLKRSPFHYRAARLVEREDTDAMRLGRATHVAALEPEQFSIRHAIWEGGRRFGKEWDRFCADNSTREILTLDQAEKAKAMAKSVLTNEHAAAYLRGGKAELTLQWTHEEAALGGVPGFSVDCKARVDFAAKTAKALVDIKTCDDASPEAFQRSCWNYGYYIQASMYRDGLQKITGEELPYLIAAVESKAPFAVQLYWVSPFCLAKGRQEYRALLRLLHTCRSENHWPGYGEGVLELGVPSFVENDDDVTGLGLVIGG